MPVREEAVVQAWLRIGHDSLGAAELLVVRRSLVEEFGEIAAPSPASIARILAENGARLRHSEILDVDTVWRESRYNELFAPKELSFSSIHAAVDSMRKMEELRRHFELEEDTSGLDRLRELAVGLKDEFRLVARARVKVAENPQLAEEFATWLTNWIQAPDIFQDWIDLRRRTPDFVTKFKRL